MHECVLLHVVPSDARLCDPVTLLSPGAVRRSRYYTVLEGDHILYIISRLRAGMKFEMLYGSIFRRCRSSLALTHTGTHTDTDARMDAHAFADASSNSHSHLHALSAASCETQLVPLREKHATRLSEQREGEELPQQWQQQRWLQNWQWQWQPQGQGMADEKSAAVPCSDRGTVASHLKHVSDSGPLTRKSRRLRSGHRRANENSSGEKGGAESFDTRGNRGTDSRSIGSCSGSSTKRTGSHRSADRAAVRWPNVTQRPKEWLDLDLGGFNLFLRLPGMRVVGSDSVRGGAEHGSEGKGGMCAANAKDGGRTVSRYSDMAHCGCGCHEGSVRDVFHMLDLCCPATS